MESLLVASVETFTHEKNQDGGGLRPPSWIFTKSENLKSYPLTVGKRSPNFKSIGQTVWKLVRFEKSKMWYKNYHEFFLLKMVAGHIVGNVREERTEIVGCRFEGIRRRRERYVKLSVVSIEVVIVSAREWIYEWAEGGSVKIEDDGTKDRALGDARGKRKRRGWETRCSDYEGTRSEIRGEPVKCDASNAEPSRESVDKYGVVNGVKCSRKVKESEKSDLFERYGVDDNLCHKLLKSVTNRYHRMVTAAKKTLLLWSYQV
jgi:hypothetical protein